MTDTIKHIFTQKALAWICAFITLCGFFYWLGGRDEVWAKQIENNWAHIEALEVGKADREELEIVSKKTDQLMDIYAILAELKKGAEVNEKRTDRIENKLDQLIMSYPNTEGR